jgi:metal-responsive CopG/Arc/MetJ family transcriptional regulator
MIWRMTMLSFRADDALAAELDVEAARAGVARSELLTRAVRELLYRMRCERDAETYARIPVAAAELFGAEVTAWPDDDGTDWDAVFER